jgi:hypothetical protein
MGMDSEVLGGVRIRLGEALMIRPGWNRRDLRGLQSQKIGRCEARIVCELQKQQSDENEIEAALRDGGLDEERWRPSVALPNPNLTLVRPSTLGLRE